MRLKVSYRDAMKADPGAFGLSWKPVGSDAVVVEGDASAMDAWTRAVNVASVRARYILAVGGKGVDLDAEYLDRYSRPEGACVVWHGPVNLKAHMEAINGNRLMTPTQLAWLKYRKNEPLPRRIGRTCGTRGCVNPAHLK